MADSRYGIGEWYGRQLLAMSRGERALLADVALAEDISDVAESRRGSPIIVCRLGSSRRSGCLDLSGRRHLLDNG